ncbi:hypothetical protein OIO90_005816 [Microbotryomycetes sp. JL221]|nr:hypothetical protein OIO90_005816 [Microbotryomycetes sp. JL221]
MADDPLDTRPPTTVGVGARPLIDRRRSSSRERSSFGTVVIGSPPSNLRSAMKHNHVHPEPRFFDDDDDEGSRPSSTVQQDQQQYRPSSTSTLTLDTRSDTNLTSTSNTSVNNTTQYTRKVGFDTFASGRDLDDKAQSTGGGTGVNYSFTIGAKSSRFCRTRATRTYLVATDLNEYSVHALDWAMDNITEDHDELVILRVIDPGSSAHSNWKSSKDEAREEAESVLNQVMTRNREQRQISIAVEFAIGPIEETIHRMIEIYRPDSLVVGTRGKPDSLFKMGPYMGSISKWAVARSPVPVIVVRPSKLIAESLSTRASRDVKKRSYVSLLTAQDIERTKTFGWARNDTGGLLLPPGGGHALTKQTTAPEEDVLERERRKSTEQQQQQQQQQQNKDNQNGGMGGVKIEKVDTREDDHHQVHGVDENHLQRTTTNQTTSSNSKLRFKLSSLGIGNKKKGLKFKKYDTFG